MPPPPPRKRPPKTWSRPLADLVGQAIDPTLTRQGFSESDLILNWDEIVGGRLAAHCRPIKLQWPPRPAGRDPDRAEPAATLVIRVEGSFALDLQHSADQLLARINGHLGWRCVGRLAFRQGPIERRDRRDDRRPVPTAAALASAGERVAGVEDEKLREALTRLGAHVMT